MGRLSISLLGPLDIKLDEGPVSAFQSDKVRALLVYLAVAGDRAHRRETLAGLLWPDYEERALLARERLHQLVTDALRPKRHFRGVQ